jgi:hypothetical protein
MAARITARRGRRIPMARSGQPWICHHDAYATSCPVEPPPLTVRLALSVLWLTPAGPAAAQAAEPAPRVFAPGVISEPYIDTAPTFAPDGKTVYFQHSNGVRAAIMVSHLVGDVWTPPQPVSFSTRWNDLEPALSPDGRYMIFASSRPVTEGGAALDGEWGGRSWPAQGGNLWRVDRHGDTWGEPRRLSDRINQGASVFEPSLARDGALYFMRADPKSGKFHLFRAAPEGADFAAPEALPFTQAAYTDADPAVAADESYLVFGSRRTPPEELSLYVAFRHGTGWGAPVRLPDSLNAKAPLMDVRLSPDEKTLYFSRDRMIWSVPFDGLLAQARAQDGAHS